MVPRSKPLALRSAIEICMSLHPLGQSCNTVMPQGTKAVSTGPKTIQNNNLQYRLTTVTMGQYNVYIYILCKTQRHSSEKPFANLLQLFFIFVQLQRHVISISLHTITREVWGALNEFHPNEFRMMSSFCLLSCSMRYSFHFGPHPYHKTNTRLSWVLRMMSQSWYCRKAKVP